MSERASEWVGGFIGTSVPGYMGLLPVVVPKDSSADVHTLPHSEECGQFVWFCPLFF